MKETQWRSKLVIEFKKARTGDFIWAMDAKFKAGFPDLYIVIDGKPYHYELKVVNKPGGLSQQNMIKCFDKIQISVMRSLNRAGAMARGLILNTDNGYVYLLDWRPDTFYFFTSADEFKDFWTGLHSWPADGSTDEASPVLRQPDI